MKEKKSSYILNGYNWWPKQKVKWLQSGMKRIKIGTQLGRAEKTCTVKTDQCEYGS